MRRWDEPVNRSTKSDAVSMIYLTSGEDNGGIPFADLLMNEGIRKGTQTGGYIESDLWRQVGGESCCCS